MSPVRVRTMRFVIPAVLGLMLIAALAWAAKSTTPKDSPANPAKGTPTEAPAANAASAAKTAPADAAAQQKAAMDEMMKVGAPGPNHEKLKECSGSWKATVKTFMSGPQPTVTEGTADMQMILGGRYLEQRFKGTMMGMPFEGYGLTGFDKTKNMYESIWVDNSSTAMMYTEGTSADDGKTVTMKGVGMGMDGKPAPMRTEFKVVDANTNVFTLYGDMGGKETMFMEITYKKGS